MGLQANDTFLQRFRFGEDVITMHTDNQMVSCYIEWYFNALYYSFSIG
jgi:hypothetical protein